MMREEIVKALRHCASAGFCMECVLANLKVSTGKCEQILMHAAADMLEQGSHFADVRKMLRCKDCAHLEYEDLGIYYCGLHRIAGQLNPDDYCSRAEGRKENQHEDH